MSDKEVSFYELMPEILDANGETKLVASFTPSNGIRIGLCFREVDDEASGRDEIVFTEWDGWYEFDFDTDQAEQIGQALMRWAQRCRAETELIRCGQAREIDLLRRALQLEKEQRAFIQSQYDKLTEWQTRHATECATAKGEK